MSSAEATEQSSDAHQPMGLVEFVVFASSAMAVNALAVSIMLAALTQIATSYALQSVNNQQLVLTVFFAGFSLGQLIVGPLSDRYGRRAPLIVGFAIYSLASLACIAAPTFTALIIARFVQGLASASPRVITISSVRDCYVGRRMASLMSLVTMVLFLAPIIAPTIGQVLLIWFSWQSLFGILLVHGLAMLVWTLQRFPETQPAAARRPLEVGPQVRGRRRRYSDWCGTTGFAGLTAFHSGSAA